MVLAGAAGTRNEGGGAVEGGCVETMQGTVTGAIIRTTEVRI